MLQVQKNLRVSMSFTVCARDDSNYCDLCLENEETESLRKKKLVGDKTTDIFSKTFVPNIDNSSTNLGNGQIIFSNNIQSSFKSYSSREIFNFYFSTK